MLASVASINCYLILCQNFRKIAQYNGAGKNRDCYDLFAFLDSTLHKIITEYGPWDGKQTTYSSCGM